MEPSEIQHFVKISVQKGTLDQDLKDIQDMLKIIERPEYRIYFKYSKADLQHIRVYVTGLFRAFLSEKNRPTASPTSVIDMLSYKRD